MANFEDINKMAYNSYEKAKTAVNQLSTARSQAQQAEASLYAAEIAYSRAIQLANSINYDDDENGYARQTAMAAVSEANSQRNIARAKVNAIRQQIQISTQQLQACREDFRQYVQICENQLKNLEETFSKLSELRSRTPKLSSHYSNILNTTKEQSIKYSKLGNNSQKCIENINSILNDGGECPERVRER